MSYVCSVDTEIYDIASDRWESDIPLPEKRGWLDAAVVGERIFAMGGALIHEDRPGHKWFDEMLEFIP